MRRKIVLVGGGSNAWAPRIVKDMLLTEAICDSRFVLFDIDRASAERVARISRKVNAVLKTPATFEATHRRDKAFEGADYIIVTISTGGLDAMAHDLAIPEEYGIFHTVGDTSGPGGWARLIRNFRVFSEMGAAINRLAPGAMVLNYTNPMTTLTQVLSRVCAGPVVGLCHGLFENLTFLKQFYRVTDETDISVSYAGLNHFFWITKARVGSTDVIADLNEQLRKKSLTDLTRETLADAMGYKSNRELATELFRVTGYMPYIGDRHTCEFFPWTITSRRNMKKYKLVRTTIQERRDQFAKRAARLDEILAGDLPQDYLDRSRETAADIVAAHAGGKPFIDVGNLPNIGQISNLPDGTVVETAIRVDQNGFAPIAFGALPDPIAGWIAPHAKAFNLLVDACFRNDRREALNALRLDPVCSHLTTDRVIEMGNRLLAANERFIDM